MEKLRLSEEFTEYNKAMAKWNVYGSTLDDIERLIESGKLEITMTEKRYEKGNLKGFPRKPTEEKSEVIKARNYACYISSIGCFNDKVTQGYTLVGFIPTELKSISWGDGSIKVIRSFNFKVNQI